MPCGSRLCLSRATASIGCSRTSPPFRFLRLKPGVEPANVEFPSIGYDEIALHSYESFKAAREAGKIAPGTRFQVSLPTPFGVLGVYVIPEDITRILPRFEEAYMREVDTILKSIPHDDLSMQWDIAVEIVGALEAHTPRAAPAYAEGVPCGSDCEGRGSHSGGS